MADKKYLIIKLRKTLLNNIERVINEEQLFKYKKEKLRGFKLYYVLYDIINGCDYHTLKQAKKLIKNDWVSAVKFLLSIVN